MDLNGISNVMGTTEAQTELAVKVVNSPTVNLSDNTIDDLRQAVSNISNNRSSSLFTDKFSKKSSSIKITAKLTPNKNDILTAKTLENLIASGFLLLHNDLNRVSSKGKSSTSTSLSTAAIGGAVGGAVGGAIGGAVGGFVTGLAGAFKNDPTDDHFNSIISELNLQLTADDFADDPEVKEYQDKGFKEYLQAYYREKANALLAGVAGDVVASAIVGVGEGLKKLFGKDNNEEVDKLKVIADDLTESMSTDWFLNDREVLDIQKSSFKEYLKVYYKMQVDEIRGERAKNISSDIGEVIVSFGKGIFNALFGKTDQVNNTFLDKVKEVDIELSKVVTVEELATDDAILTTYKSSISNYLSNYYKMQVDEIRGERAKSISSDIGEVVVSFGKGIFNALFDRKEQQANSTFLDKVKEVDEKLTESITVDDLVADDAILTTYKSSISNYLSNYYKMQVDEIKGERAKNISSDIGEVIGSFGKSMFTALFGKNDQATDSTNNIFLDKVKEVDEKLTESITVDDLVADDTIITAYKSSVANYMSNYYKMQADEIRGERAKSISSDIGEVIGNFGKSMFTALFGKNDQATDSTNNIFLDKAMSVDAKLNEEYTVDDLVADDTVITAYKSSVASYISNYYKMQADEMTGARISNIASSIGEAIGSFGKGIFTALFGRKEQQATDSTNDAFLNKVMLVDAKLNEEYTVDDLVADDGLKSHYQASIGAVLTTYYNLTFDNVSKEVENAIKDISLTKEQKSSFAVGSQAIINKVSKLAKEDFEVSTSSINQAKDDAVKDILTSYFTAAKANLESRATGFLGTNKVFSADQIETINNALVNTLASTIENPINTSTSSNIAISSQDNRIDDLLVKLDEVINQLTSLNSGVQVSNLEDIAPSTIIMSSTGSNDLTDKD